jgi:putative metallohydrolase (TIGR04338 family)
MSPTTTTRQRDTQRQRVYDAETAAFGRDSEEMTLAECQAFVDKCLSSAWLRKRFPRAAEPVEVRDGRSRRRAGYGPGAMYLVLGSPRIVTRPNIITMPRWTRSKWQLLHELAHHLSRHEPAHGWQFAECYLYLVRVFLGRGREEMLKEQFKAHRVRFREPRERRMTQEQREAARQRMLAMHAARAAGSTK